MLVIGGAAFAAYHLTRHDGAEPPRSTVSVPGETATSRPVRPSAPQPGDQITIELIAAPATHYGRVARIDPYAEIAAQVAGRRARYDGNLAAAAREVAFHSAVLGSSPPEAVIGFLLHGSGAPESSVARFVLHTNGEGEEVIERAIEEALLSAPAGRGELVFGLGEADTPGDRHRRRIVVLMARRRFALESAPRFAELDSTWTMRGRLPRDLTDPSALVLYPDGSLAPIPVKTRGTSFLVTAPTGTVPGTIEIGIDGVGATGPGKLLQLTVEVGRPLPRRLVYEIPETDPLLDSIEEAEAYAADLLAADRLGANVPPLEIDPALSAIARSHSEEMRDLGYFGHQSPRTGLAADRVRAARYRAIMTGENLAKNDSLGEAEASLLASVGHRANLLSPEFTHVGVGVARVTERGQTQWFVTQLFARKAVDLDAGAALKTVLHRLAAAREARGAGALEISEVLGEVAERGAELAIEAPGDDLAERLGAEARELRGPRGRGVAVSVQVIYELSQLELGGALLDPAMTELGVAVYQPPGALDGAFAVVIIAGR